MAGELQASGEPGRRLYALVIDAGGRLWTAAGFAEPAAGAWPGAAIELAECAGTGMYRADMPGAAAGIYAVEIRETAGDRPDPADPLIAEGGPIHWDGEREVRLAEVHALLGLNSGVRNAVYDAGRLASFDVCLYDNAAHAALNDGVTGLVARYAVTNGYAVDGDLTSSVTRKVA